MKRLAIAIAATLALSACTSEVTVEEATRVQGDEAFAPGQGDAAITIVRDGGIYGMGCGIEISIDGRYAATLGSGDSFTAYVAAGTHELTADVPGLCGGQQYHTKSTSAVGKNAIIRLGLSTLTPNIFRQVDERSL